MSRPTPTSRRVPAVPGQSQAGMKNGQSKLTDAEVLAIRALKGRMLAKEIAIVYQVSRVAVWKIHARHTWRHL